MIVRITIPTDDSYCHRNYSPNMVAAKRQQQVREYLVDSRLHTILTAHQISYRILDTFVFAVMDDAVFIEIKLACDLHLNAAKNNMAPEFKVTYDDPQEKEL